MSEGKTLWQIFNSKKEVTPEYYNPIRARVDSLVKVDKIDFRNTQFVIDSIREYTREVGGAKHVFTDYYLRGGDSPTKVRVMQDGTVVLIKQFDELNFDDGFLAVVNDDNGQFEIKDDDTGKVDLYKRLQDLRGPWDVDVVKLEDKSGDGKLSKDEVHNLKVDYWDYWRQAHNEVNEPYTEYLFVEMAKPEGQFTLWRGTEIDPQAVTIF